MNGWLKMLGWTLKVVLLSAIGLGFFSAQIARADSSVVVLGVRSLDGDDELARQVSQSLREGAKQVTAWKISDRDVSLAQMSLAHGCDEPDARCMADIAGTLEVDRLIYGTMVRNEQNLDIALFNFDAVTGQVESSISAKVPAESLTGVSLKATTASLAKRLAGIEVTGALRVRGGAAGAQVSIDGKEVGNLDARGELLLAGVAVGTHQLKIEKGEAKSEQSIEIKEAETTTAQMTLAAATLPDEDVEDEAPAPRDDGAPSESNPRLRRILGWSAVGLAGAFAVATTYTWVRIDKINSDSDLAEYRDQFPPATSDVCTEADNNTLAITKRNPALTDLEGNARSLCNEADTLEVLQYVFLGGAIAAGGVGAYLLLTSKDPKPSQALTLQPRFAQGRTQISATLRF